MTRTLEARWEAHRLAIARGYPQTTHQIRIGDARLMPEVSPSSVHLVVTSPPYLDLVSYSGVVGQIGDIGSMDVFISEANKVWRRCFDSLVPGGKLCIVVGDVCRARSKAGRHFVEPLHAHLLVDCQSIGFDPLATIAWHKIANIKTEVGGRGSFLGKPYEPNGVIKNDLEWILVFNKPGGYRSPSQEQRDLSMIAKDNHHAWFRQVWSDVPGARKTDHPAPYPIEIPSRLIQMYSFVGDTVLDPFIGTGTTAVVAKMCGRNSIGYEICPEYAEIAKNRINDSRTLFDAAG